MFKELRSKAATECGELQLPEGERGRAGEAWQALHGEITFHSAWNDPDCQAGMRPRRAAGSGPAPPAPLAPQALSSWKEQTQDGFIWYHLGKWTMTRKNPDFPADLMWH